MSDIWEFVQRADHHIQPKSPKSQAASDEMERDHHEAVGIWRYMLRELEAAAEASDALNGTLNDAIRAAVAAAEREVGA